jgi:GntR family transcriptional regulator
MLSGDGPIFLQLAERVAEDIINGTYAEETAVPSTNEYAAFYQISPITAAKGIGVLVEQEALYKKRGIGMFVSQGARGRPVTRTFRSPASCRALPAQRERRCPWPP